MINLSKLTVKQVGERFLASGEVPSRDEFALLESDPRAGVRRVASTLKKRSEKKEREKRRIYEMLERETLLWGSGISYIAGVDEVGVGPFAGPVVAAAVVFSPDVHLEGIRDSKKLDHKRRVKLDEDIRRVALAFGIGLVDVEDIDRLNIRRAALQAMRLAILDLNMKVQHVLVDGGEIPGIGIPQEAIIDGDEKVYSIAAASIIAKVHRDNIMLLYDSEFPQYGFARHKGYGTAEHIRALKEHGPCEIHRKSFEWRR